MTGLGRSRAAAAFVSSFIFLGMVSAADAAGNLKRVTPSEVPEIQPDGSLSGFKIALKRQIAACLKQNQNATFNFDGESIPRRKFCLQTAREFLRLAEKASDFGVLMELARTKFDWYQSIGKDTQGEVKFTGYYSPTLEVRAKSSGEFIYPIYAKPTDLVRVIENGKKVWRKRNPDGSFGLHSDRKAIDVDGALKSRGLEIAFSKDLFGVAVLQIQGAGTLKFDDGRTIIANYAAENGHPYVHLSRVLKEKGVPSEFLTIFGMRRYFALHPEELVPILVMNLSYVFFQTSNEGPYGLDEIVLSGGHSTAVDTSALPLGAVSLFRTSRPVVSAGEITRSEDFSRLAITQDTGGSIKGPGHVDIFWGDDSYAEIAAGVMNNPGVLYFAVAR
jgi:membrane-bound lytic murein transglycosylase A